MVVAFVALFPLLSGPLQGSNPVDVRAFVCAGEVVNSGQDPYRVEPLRACEHRLAAASGESLIGGVAIPAPLPAYAIVPFRVLAAVPFPVAREIVTLATLLASVLTIVLLQRLTQRPMLAVASVLVVADLYVSLLTGQIATLSVAAAVAAAYGLAHGRPRSAGLLAAIALVEPHLGLPVVLGIACFVPPARATLAAGLAVLGAASLLAPHGGYVLEYFGEVLPLHLRSELFSDEQLGTAPLLAALHVAPGLALRLATPLYALGVALGLVAAGRSRRSAAAAGRSAAADPLVVFAPLAMGVAFAPFSHVTQACAAIPLLVVLAARAAPAPPKALVAGALALLAIPWILFGENLTAAPAAGLFGGVTALAASVLARLGRRTTVALVAADVALAVVIALAQTPRAAPPATLAADLARVDPAAIAEVSWQQFMDAAERATSLGSLLAKLATWSGLFGTAALPFTIPRTPRP